VGYEGKSLNPRHSPKCSESGFTYIGLLIVVSLVGVMLAEAATVWHQIRQQENERQLLFVGNQFRQAIGSYYINTPGQQKEFPKKLEDLLEDRRTPFVLRHLRKIFYDPITVSTDWGLVKAADNSIMGVFSKSDTEPIKKTNFSKLFAMFDGRKHYSDWQFVYASGVAPDLVVAQSDGAAPAPALQPIEVIPPEYQPGPPPVNTNSKDQKQNRRCNSMNRVDLSTCLTLSKKFGDAAGANCLASAANRYTACLNGEMMSPLDVQY